jgi:hypothetical protein
MGLPGRHLLLDNPDRLWKVGLPRLLIGLRLSEEDSRRLCLTPDPQKRPAIGGVPIAFDRS